MSQEPRGWTELDEPAHGDTRAGRGTGISKWSFLVLTSAIAIAVVLGQNTERVDVDVLWTSFRAPLFVVVLLAALGLTALWEIATSLLRHRRRRGRRGQRV